jgi:hypothetical protein
MTTDEYFIPENVLDQLDEITDVEPLMRVLPRVLDR